MLTDQKPNSEHHGIWRIIPSSTITEIIIQSGFNFQIFDLEHGAYDFQALESDIRVCHYQNGLAYVRVSGLNKVEVQRCLDLGADGIVFPQLNNFEDFKLATMLIQYPPKGIRGFNPFVVAGEYGFKKIFNKKIDCIVIIETLHAFYALDEILKLPEVDVIYIGVYDLSAQLDSIGIVDSPQLVSVIDEIIFKCSESSKRIGLIVKNSEEYARYKEKGVDTFVHIVDSYQIKSAFLNVIEKLKY